ncbi:hypothetical protein B566_EDAN017389 [Ephemera danica]|nr:hypothetical protein B566_EDAN017389 [Ephemera danica]
MKICSPELVTLFSSGELCNELSQAASKRNIARSSPGISNTSPGNRPKERTELSLSSSSGSGVFRIRPRNNRIENNYPPIWIRKNRYLTNYKLSDITPAQFRHVLRPRRQEVCKGELLISTHRQALEKVVLGLWSHWAQVFIVNLAHELQTMSMKTG